MKPQRVLVVEDEAPMRDFYRLFFDKRLAGEFEAVIVADAEQALSVLRRAPVDLVVMDWGLPGISGAQLTKALRSDASTRALGIIMVTAKASQGEEIVALEFGADDHLAKPFDEKVLQARLRSLARRGGLSADRRQEKGTPGIDLNYDTGHVTIDGRSAQLTPKELQLLSLFLQKPNTIHTQAYIWQTLWGYKSELWERLLTAMISTLRSKLGPKWSARLRTHPGKGYSLDESA